MQILCRKAINPMMKYISYYDLSSLSSGTLYRLQQGINAGDYEGHECVPTLTPEEEKCWLVAAMSVYQHLQLVVAIPLSAKRLNSKYSSRSVYLHMNMESNFDQKKCKAIF